MKNQRCTSNSQSSATYLEVLKVIDMYENEPSVFKVPIYQIFYQIRTRLGTRGNFRYSETVFGLLGISAFLCVFLCLLGNSVRVVRNLDL